VEKHRDYAVSAEKQERLDRIGKKAASSSAR
jgi:hypothetical protein